jgi:hypothetical protein
LAPQASIDCIRASNQYCEPISFSSSADCATRFSTDGADKIAPAQYSAVGRASNALWNCTDAEFIVFVFIALIAIDSRSACEPNC